MSFDGVEIKSNGTVTQNGAPASTEESVVTFEDMVKDQTLTIGGLTFKAAATKTAAEPLIGVVSNRANANLAKTQRLAGLEFRTEFPRNALGKVLKRELRAPWWDEAK